IRLSGVSATANQRSAPSLSPSASASRPRIVARCAMGWLKPSSRPRVTPSSNAARAAAKSPRACATPPCQSSAEVVQDRGGERPAPRRPGAVPPGCPLEPPARCPIVPQPEPDPVQCGREPQRALSAGGILLEPVGGRPQVPEVLRQPLLPPLGLV